MDVVDLDNDATEMRRCVAILLKKFDYLNKELCTKPLKELVSIVRKRDDLVPRFVDILFKHLRAEDCDVRLGILLLANHFFQRSHIFRQEIIHSMQDFLVYTLETDPLHYPLPKPESAATMLKKDALCTLHCWIAKFGPGYPKLARLGEFLKNSKSFDWQSLQTNLLIDREREQRQRFQQELRAHKVLEAVKTSLDNSKSEIERLIVEAHSLVNLIFPLFCSTKSTGNKDNENNVGGGEQPQRDIQESLHGLVRPNGITICINLNGTEVQESPENVDLLRQLRETTRQLEKWNGRMNAWLKKLAEIGNSSALTLRIIDIRQTLAEELQKCRDIKVKGMEGDHDQDDDDHSSDSDDDLIDVEEKEGFEPDFIDASEHDPVECGPGPSGSQQQPTNVVCCPPPKGATIKTMNNQQESTTKHLELETSKKATPKLMMGLDLKYWGNDDVKPAERVGNELNAHPFWRAPDINETQTETMEVYRARQITFIGEMPPIRRSCRAPLPSGKLCPRMDRYRCPLHGQIVDRDEQGFPLVQQSESARSDKSIIGIIEERKKREQEEEEEYLRDIETATGAKLTDQRPKRNSAGKRTARARPARANNTRQLLKDKLFNKRTMKRVTDTLTQMGRRKAERRFAAQFNYMLERK